MNYYPYLNGIPYTTSLPMAKTGFFKNLFGNLNFSSILNGTQKTLGLVNQAIPLIKQAGPVINNAKTMFKVMNEFKKNDIVPVVKEKENNIENQNKFFETPSYKNNGPIFFQ